MEGFSLVSVEGSSLVSVEGSSLVSVEGSSVVSVEGSSVVSVEGSSVVSVIEKELGIVCDYNSSDFDLDLFLENEEIENFFFSCSFLSSKFFIILSPLPSTKLSIISSLLL